MPKINRLPPQVVDMIAAGEVIERPASVVKELVENSLDAGARSLTVTVEGGGRDLVAVVDDGTGIDAEDLPLAVESHATSKLKTAADLFEISTLGFRGEALASIAAVSLMKIASRAAGAPLGAVIEVRGGVPGPPRAAGLPVGTAIEVRKLFFNAPVRRRFLKQESTELGHVSSVLTQYALAHPALAFSLSSGGKSVFHAPPAAELRERIALFYSSELAAALVQGELETEGFAMKVLVAPPEYAKTSPKSIHTFLNGRAVRDKTLLHAVGQAFRDTLPKDRHPVAFAFLLVHPEEVDVNVHPGKLEVRFRDQGRIHALVEKTVREALGARESRAPSVELSGLKEALEGDAPGSPPRQASFFRDGGQSPRERVREALQEYYAARTVSPTHASLPPERSSGGSGMEESRSAPVQGRPTPVLQAHDSFLVRECADGLEIIDQHALAERLKYDEIRPRVEKEGLASQRLLVPLTLDLKGRQSSLLAANLDLFRKFGLEVDKFGPSTFAVHSIPAFLPDSEVEGFLEEALDEIAENRSSGLASRIDAVAKRLACRAAVKAGTRLNQSEIKMLLDGADRLPGAPTCPHGRPAVVRVTLAELEKHFGRR